MALSGLDIYKLLPKTNCKECGFATCLAFAMQLAKKAVSIEKCPHLSAETKQSLEASSLPPIKLITIGAGEDKLEVGNETVMFRHEEKFQRPTGIGFIIEDTLSDSDIKKKLQELQALSFERVGQQLNVNLVAISQKGPKDKFLKAVQLVCANTRLGIVLMPLAKDSLAEALKICSGRNPLVYQVTKENIADFVPVLKENKVPVVASALDIESLVSLTKELTQAGISDIIINTQDKTIKDKIWDLTQLRRLALKKSNRAVGFPSLVVVENSDPYEEAIEVATYIAKYASIILMHNTASWEVLSLLTLRQNIFTDPQKPLQIEPKLYPIGNVSDKSPLLVTTNFSLSYYTVLGEVEASKVPSYILSVDTEGQSVLTAWASEKFTAEQVSKAMEKLGATEAVSHKSIIIPGYVAVMSGDLEEQSGWKVIVGPKEAAGLPQFLKKLTN